jgi:hypothetical protein
VSQGFADAAAGRRVLDRLVAFCSQNSATGGFDGMGKGELQ